MLIDFLRRFDVLCLAVSASVLSAIFTLRYLWTVVTGFITGDEALYFLPRLYPQFEFVSSRHRIFQLTNMFFTQTLDINNIFEYLAFSYVSSMFWNLLCLFVIYKTLKLVTKDRRAIGLTLLSVPLIAVYPVMNALYIGEAPSLFFVFAGIYCMIRFSKQKTKRLFLFAAGCFFILAQMYHDPWITFILFNFLLVLYWLISQKIGFKSLLCYSVPLCFTRIPFSITSLAARLPESLAEELLALFMPFKSVVPQSSTAILPHIQFAPENYFLVGTLMPTGNMADRFMVTLVSTVRGLVFGWSGIFLFVLVASFVVFCFFAKKDECWDTLFVNVVTALVSFPLLMYMMSNSSYLETITASSICFRFSFLTLPALLLFPYFYQRIKTKYLIVVGLVCLVLVSAFFPMLFYTVQSNQSEEYVNRIDFGYRAPYMRLYEEIKAIDGSVAVLADPAIRAFAYTKFTDASFFRIMLNETTFLEIYEAHDVTFLYGEKWFHYYGTVKATSTFYYSLIFNQTDYSFDVVWDDAESHLYMLDRRE